MHKKTDAPAYAVHTMTLFRGLIAEPQRLIDRVESVMQELQCLTGIPADANAYFTAVSAIEPKLRGITLNAKWHCNDPELFPPVLFASSGKEHWLYGGKTMPRRQSFLYQFENMM